jgi:hypothetical protein
MQSMQHLCLKGSVAAGLLLVACAVPAQSVEIKWGGDGRFSRTVKVVPGKPSEFCGDVKAARALLWSFESSQVLNYSVYQPEGAAKSQAATQASAWKHAGRLDAAAGARYCWNWTNPGDKPVELAVDIRPAP